MTSSTQMVRSEIRKLARKGRLIDECFKTFQRTVFPGAAPDQVAAMRTCFFAGAAELKALIMHGLDDGTEETDGDMAFMQQWQDELTRFHERTVQTAMQTPKGTA